MMKAIEGWLTMPRGFVTAGVKAGIKASGKHDVAIILSTIPAATGAVFTQNKVCAAPVLLSRKVSQRLLAQGIVVNSGCANASTGKRGIEDARRMQELTGQLVNTSADNIYVCSTGVIGQFLPMDKVEAGIKAAANKLSIDEGESAALAIQTTDTFMKKVVYEFEIDGKVARIAGIAKGAGMIHPNMATLLTFVTTDAAVESGLLKRIVKRVADESFNMVVIDGDTSTNDSMIVMANGLAGNSVVISEDHPDYQCFYDALLRVARELAIMVAHDGEGATKFLEVNVIGAKSFADAKLAAMAIAKSPLVKTAFFGEDPNWGRVACAAGYSGAEMDAEHFNLSIGGVQLVRDGLNANVSLEELAPIMSEHDITITVDMAVGEEKATVWTCDFSYEYVKINGEYHT